MNELTLSSPLARGARPALRARRLVPAAVVALLVFGNAGVIVWLWYHGGNVTKVHTTAEALTSIGRITGLLSAYLALLQVILLARLPALERAVGFDRLSRWHRWNGHACIDLVIAHVVFTVWGYTLADRFSLGKEISTMLGGGVYPGMITATIGTGMLLAVVATSLVIVRRRLPYEWWYAVHLLAYAGIALSWFHEIPTGNEFVLDQNAADYWRALYVATLVVLVVFRVLAPLAAAFRYGIRVAEVTRESDSVVSVRMTGRNLEKLNASAGHFFLWRFLDRHRWWTSHPFSLSAAPDDRSLRITVKALGDHTGRLGELRPGTRVVAEGPFGTFTPEVRKRDKAVLIAGGIGITPIRALLETMAGDVVVLYRVVAEGDIVFRKELNELAAARGAVVHYIVGDHRGEGADLLAPPHLKELVHDIEERDVFVCGPPAMTLAIERNVRGAQVPRRQIHTERFALA